MRPRLQADGIYGACQNEFTFSLYRNKFRYRLLQNTGSEFGFFMVFCATSRRNSHFRLARDAANGRSSLLMPYGIAARGIVS